jgi:hypothetical protein
MENCRSFIEHILNTTNDELLLKFWHRQLEQLPEQEMELASSLSKDLFQEVSSTAELQV